MMERVLHALVRTSKNQAGAICRRRIRARHYVKQLVTESVQNVPMDKHMLVAIALHALRGVRSVLLIRTNVIPVTLGITSLEQSV